MQAKQRFVYVVATLVTMVIFLPFQGRVTSPGACAGYTVLVFGLAAESRTVPPPARQRTSSVFLTHIWFLTIVIGWVWLLLFVKPHLPYILTTEDGNASLLWTRIFGNTRASSDRSSRNTDVSAAR